MKKTFNICLVLFIYSCIFQQPIVLAQEGSSTSELLEQAAALLEKREYDSVIRLLEGPALSAPSNFEINWLLSSAVLEKCEMMKRSRDEKYKHSIMRPYEIGARLLKVYPHRPEPYYLIARSLAINNRFHKAGGYILKAIHFSTPSHKNYADFQMVLGDSYFGQMLQSTKRGPAEGHKKDTLYIRAREAYKNARELRKDDPIFVERINRRLNWLEKRSNLN
jgi:hypothetical protein